jgi:mannose-6-phosphate isomerase-like protein (cupin superfamily)
MGHSRTIAIVAAALLGVAPALSATQAAQGVAVEIRVTDRTGAPIEKATVMLEGGPSSRDGATSPQGSLTLRNVRAGTYRLHVERDGFVTLEKDVVVRTARVTVEAALTPAPPPPEPPPAPPPSPPPPAPEPPPLVPGAVALVSVPEMAEEMLESREARTETLIGCSGATLARLIMLPETLAAHAHDDADETLYVVAGEATITIGERRQNISAGWFGVVPRTVSHTIALRGRNPPILLSTLSGPPCPAGGRARERQLPGSRPPALPHPEDRRRADDSRGQRARHGDRPVGRASVPSPKAATVAAAPGAPARARSIARPDMRT